MSPPEAFFYDLLLPLTDPGCPPLQAELVEVVCSSLLASAVYSGACPPAIEVIIEKPVAPSITFGAESTAPWTDWVAWVLGDTFWASRLTIMKKEEESSSLKSLLSRMSDSPSWPFRMSDLGI